MKHAQSRWCCRPLAAAVIAVALLPGAVAGCKKRQAPTEDARPAVPPPPSLGSVSVRVGSAAPMPGIRLDAGALEAALRSQLSGAGVFSALDAGTSISELRTRVEVSLEDVVAGEKGAARAAVRLRMNARPEGGAERHWEEDVQAQAESLYAPGESVDRSALFQKLVTRTLQDLTESYLARQRLWVGDPTLVKKALGPDAGELRIEAFRVIAERRLLGQVDPLLAALGDPEESVRDAALGALVELRERRAVSVLAKQRSMRDRREMRKILDAMAILGGPEAADYLAFVSDGHDDEEIRAMATEAHKRLLRRQSADARPRAP